LILSSEEREGLFTRQLSLVYEPGTAMMLCCHVWNLRLDSGCKVPIGNLLGGPGRGTYS
jgi:hypothetical protein